MQDRVVHGVLAVLLVTLLLAVFRPPPLFERDGTIRPFGVGPGKTLVSYGVVTAATALLAFAGACVLDLAWPGRPAAAVSSVPGVVLPAAPPS